MAKSRTSPIPACLSILLSAILLSLSSPVTADTPTAPTTQKAILITGASSGIGLKTTQTLSSAGYFVYAGARKQEDLDALNAMENVQAIRLDVTVQDEIDAAVETVRKGGRGLYGLVNNAGVAMVGPLIETDVGELEWLFDVNVFGVYRVTQAFASLVIESRGRIVNISSISGINVWAMGGLYTMSKHALEAYSETLALEMARFDVQVSAVEPGNFKSDISSSARKRLSREGVQNQDTKYAEEWARIMEGSGDRSQYREPDEVAAAISHALFDADPKARYMVTPNQEEAQWTIDGTIRELVELNERQPYSYSREQLIEMLDAAMNDSK